MKKTKKENLYNFSKIKTLIRGFDSIDIKKPINSILKKTAEALNVETASIALIESEKFLRFIKSLDHKPDDWVIGINEGIIGQAIFRKKSFFINNTDQSPYFDPEIDKRTKTITQSVLATPLKIGKKIIGAIEVINKKGNRFTKYDARVLDVISRKSAYIIKNALFLQDAEIQKAKWEVVFKQAGYGKALLDKYYQFMNVNKSFESLIGYKEKEILTRFIHDFISFRDAKGRSLETQFINESLKNSGNFDGEVIVFSKRKKQFWAQLNISPIEDAENEIKYIIVNLQDISEQKKLIEEQLLEMQTIRIQERMWRTVFNTTDAGIVLCDSKGIVLNVNDNFCEITGFKKNEVEGIHICKAREFLKPFQESPICPLENSLCPSLEVIKKHRKIEYKELWLKRKKGDTLWTQVKAYPIFSKAGKLIMVIEIIRNIDKEKKLDKEREDFITSVTHELRTPLTAVRGYLSMLLRNKDINKNKLRQYLSKAFEASADINNLVEDLLDIIRIEDNSIMNIKTVDCVQIAEQAISGLDLKLNNKNIKVVRDFPKDKLFVVADCEILKMVISNIIDNAIKYSKEGPINIKITEDKQFANIEIRDRGIGIPKKSLKKIFQKYYRVNNIPSSEISGSGLGLYLVRKLIEKMDGKISVDSRINGTSFTVNIPLAHQLPLLNIK